MTGARRSTAIAAGRHVLLEKPPGASIAEVLEATLAASPALAPYASSIALGLVVLVISYFSLILGELVPKRLDQSWELLGPSLQAQGKERYESFWKSIDDVKVTAQGNAVGHVGAQRHAVHAALREAAQASPVPLVSANLLDAETGFTIYVKHEKHNTTDAFKVRGGLNLISELSEDVRRRGVITTSTGNNGQ